MKHIRYFLPLLVALSAHAADPIRGTTSVSSGTNIFSVAGTNVGVVLQNNTNLGVISGQFSLVQSFGVVAEAITNTATAYSTQIELTVGDRPVTLLTVTIAAEQAAPLRLLFTKYPIATWPATNTAWTWAFTDIITNEHCIIDADTTTDWNQVATNTYLFTKPSVNWMVTPATNQLFCYPIYAGTAAFLSTNPPALGISALVN